MTGDVASSPPSPIISGCASVKRTMSPFLGRFGLADLLLGLFEFCISAGDGHLRALAVSIRDNRGGKEGLCEAGIICNLSEGARRKSSTSSSLIVVFFSLKSLPIKRPLCFFSGSLPSLGCPSISTRPNRSKPMGESELNEIQEQKEILLRSFTCRLPQLYGYAAVEAQSSIDLSWWLVLTTYE